jgi:hypothetical protein
MPPDPSLKCPVCGNPLNGKRTTRRFCSTKCRVKAHRASGTPRRKKGLLPGQVRILEALDGRGLMTRSEVSELARVSVGWLSDYLGRVDPAARPDAEARAGYPSLLTLGYVEQIVLDDEEDLWERVYRITKTGERALTRASRKPGRRG